MRAGNTPELEVWWLAGPIVLSVIAYAGKSRARRVVPRNKLSPNLREQTTLRPLVAARCGGLLLPGFTMIFMLQRTDR
jgi:hypothetical protein